METYTQMKDRHQGEVNALPLAFAFSRDQYRRKLAEWNITEEAARSGAIVGIGHGGFVRAEDHNKVIETFRRIREETDAAIAADQSGDGFIYQMFLYELNNHEFSYTQDIDETLDALGLTTADIKESDALRHGLYKAIQEINAGGDPFDN